MCVPKMARPKSDAPIADFPEGFMWRFHLLKSKLTIYKRCAGVYTFGYSAITLTPISWIY